MATDFGNVDLWNKDENELLPDPFPERSYEEVVQSKECKTRRNKRWDKYDTVYYNRYLEIDMVPPKLLCRKTMTKLGLSQQMEYCMKAIGMGNIGFTHYSLYPDAVRQFLASCYLEEPKRCKDVNNWQLCFKIRGVHYSISVMELCHVFGFQRRGTKYYNMKNFGARDHFWSIIGSGSYEPSSTKQALIRHPVLRILSRVISHTFLRRTEVGRLYEQELTLLYYSLGDHISLPDDVKEIDWNSGALFAKHLVSLRQHAFSGGSSKRETIGSLLSPIMNFCEVPLPTFTISDAPCHRLDMSSLANANIVQEGKKYEFTRSDGAVFLFRVPHETTCLVGLDTADFAPPEGECEMVTPPCQLPGAVNTRPRRHRRAQPPRASTSQPRESFHAQAGGRHSAGDMPDFFELPTQPPFSAPDEVKYAYKMERHRRKNKISRWFWSFLTGCSQDQQPHTPTPPTHVPEPEEEQHDDDDATESDDGPIGRPTGVQRGESFTISTEPVNLSRFPMDPMMMQQPPPDFFGGTGSSLPFDDDFQRRRSRSPR